ncbi:uncharacterized protein LOC130451386 isoform X1 [Diorhabda sublineata]|uniref:uncharacterized protein LOC130451386 isoform X1 n=1 Tax=Diorhabda sublineata TaxID=1163346 RepID=UPI0024E06406|nr:uncharacterized protein LOC130451386 isoform X1 [Diorhabda sublineata]
MSENQASLNKEESEETSDDNLEIVIESQTRKRKPPPEPTESERQIIESIEDELERKLEEKAAKTNLNAVHVRKIIRQVVTNEHVLTLIRNADNAKAAEGTLPIFEPKWTRSKTKELGSVPGAPIPPIPPVTWSATKPSSEVQALFTEELQEDSSGDEYIPTMADEDKDDLEESEDDPDSSICTTEPPTSPCASSPVPTAQTNWSVDGVFKIPTAPKEKEDAPDEATIALRTRSKLSLSSTPLEIIEEAFIPPDITTDMYEMDCDNEDWKNFLKTFTRPLEEVNKLPEEEELDPEYNVLSDEEIDKPDKEELRVDKAVKVSRKELNALISELYEFCSNEQAYLNQVEDDEPETTNFLNSHLSFQNSMNNSENSIYTDNTLTQKNDFNDKSIFEATEKMMLTDLQIGLLGQQLRQHVQLMTQNYLLTYQHPELHDYSIQMKEYLYNFKYLGDYKEKSVFHTYNLSKAIDIMKYWEELLASNSEDVIKMKKHIETTIYESLKYKQTGSEYIVTFPTLILETISKSDIFLYTSLLPKIPFKTPKLFTSKIAHFNAPELNLVALGIEEFMPLVTEELEENPSKKKLFTSLAEYIHEYLLPIKEPKQIVNQMYQSENFRPHENPIKYYFQNNKAPTCIHYFILLEDLQILPPCKRRPEDLPFQWKNFIYPQKIVNQSCISLVSPCSGTEVYSVSKPVYNIQKQILPKVSTPTPLRPSERKRRLKRPSRRSKLAKTNLLYRGQDPITKFKKCLSQPTCINKLLQLFFIDTNVAIKHKDKNELDGYTEYTLNFESSLLNRGKNRRISTSSSIDEGEVSKMLPNMPSLGTPVKIGCGNNGSGNTIEGKTVEISEVGISKFQLSSSECITTENVKLDIKNDNKGDITKDNQEDLNALLIASSTVKPPTKKEPTVAEKKKAKMTKEFLANLAISTPEDRKVEKQKNEMFALAYYDKMRETLEIEAYHKIMQILNDYEEGDAIDLYRKIEPVLRVKYKDLADEFLLFLREREAAAVGRLIPWIRMNNRSKFLRKLEIYFKDQPSQLRKIYQCLTELSQAVGVSMEKIKTTLIPMFKGNAVLTDLFLQNFLDEPPPLSLLEGPSEVFDINKELSQSADDEPCEIFTVPDAEDKYGGNSCICNCHRIEDAEFKSKFRHCSKCGIKFLNGTVYLQTGRGLRPATVSFLTSPNVDHQSRLADKSWSKFIHRKKHTDSSPSKQSNNSKENADEETDEDGDKKKKPKRKPQRNRKPKLTKDTVSQETQKKPIPKRRKINKSSPKKRTYSPKKTNANRKMEKVQTKMSVEAYSEGPNETEHEEQIETELEEPTETELEEPTETELEEPTETETEDKQYIKPGSNNGQLKRLHEESCEEGEQSAAGESFSEVKLGSPEQQTAESESEFCEESSQDNCETDSNSSTSSVNRTQNYAVLRQNWKREEDKIILEVFQTENDKDHAFRAIANQLENRSVDEIKSRFHKLMDLLLKTVEET